MNSSGSNKKLINDQTVRYVADLSRLSLDEGSVDKLQAQLEDILGYIAQLNEVDTENTQPTSHVLTSMKNVFRKDEPGKSLTQEEALSNAPERNNGFFKVPQVI